VRASRRTTLTIFMREIAVPKTYDGWVSGTDVWPTKPPGIPTPFDKYARLHLNGQNILYADGHSTWFKYPNSVEGQLTPGYNNNTYWTYPGASWQCRERSGGRPIGLIIHADNICPPSISG
jgi:prepilin-type processing-associated H-X9-DG protein